MPTNYLSAAGLLFRGAGVVVDDFPAVGEAVPDERQDAADCDLFRASDAGDRGREPRPSPRTEAQDPKSRANHRRTNGQFFL
jgi:hypothetical protein